MTNTRACRHPRKPGVGDDGYVFTPRDVFESRGELVCCLHTRTHGARANHNHHVTFAHWHTSGALDCCYRQAFTREHSSWAAVAIHLVRVYQACVDGCGFYDCAFGCDVAGRKNDGAGKATT